MACKRMLALSTYITELCAIKDEVTGKLAPARKFLLGIDGREVISQPPPASGNSPIDTVDERITGFGLVRTNELEQYQVETNDLTTTLLRCNTSMQPLIAPSQAKRASHYVAKYFSKDPFELSACPPFLYQSQLGLQKYGSVAEDKGTDGRNVKLFIEKVIHRVNKIEVSSQQAAFFLLT